LSGAELLRQELDRRLDWTRSHGHLRQLAVWQLVCGRAVEGLETLRSLARDAPDLDPRWALAAGDYARAERDAAELLHDSSRRYVPGYREYIEAVYALIAGDADAARRSVAELTARVETTKRLPHVPAGAVSLLGGLLDESAGELTRGLDSLLAWHVRRARARSEIFNSADAVVSVDAVMTLLLAHRRGIALRVDQRYRRASLPILVVHVEEWRGEPIAPQTMLRGTVDLVAGEWLRLQGVDVRRE
jgi:hypothetical protein